MWTWMTVRMPKIYTENWFLQKILCTQKPDKDKRTFITSKFSLFAGWVYLKIYSIIKTTTDIILGKNILMLDNLIFVYTISMYVGRKVHRLKISYKDVISAVDDFLDHGDPSTATSMKEVHGPQWGLRWKINFMWESDSTYELFSRPSY